jgi:hypothetical protein
MFSRTRLLVGLAIGSLMMLGLVAAPATAQPPGPTTDPAPGMSETELLADPAFAIIRSYTVGGSPVDTFLRRGTSTWGYTHLVAKGRWSSTFDSRIKSTLRYWDYYRRDGTSYTFESYAGGFQTWSLRVVVQYGNANQGVITAYYI